MSRTTKDRPVRLRCEPWDKDTQRYSYEAVGHHYFTGGPYVCTRHAHIDLPTTKSKKRKEVDTEDHWMSTPSRWTHLCMIKPERRLAHMLEKKAMRIEDIEDMDFPDLGKKPHIYFW